MQAEDIEKQLRYCLTKFREGNLQEEDLQGILDILGGCIPDLG